ncbi:MAG: 1-acyl-sn-glycerol-3-phosphate acyltransferase [Leptospiraceae bacterium]|nr:1-acyl-sn-glycerol-3-phosphate acyltransferase [Leptospiraceae bacterium]MCP5501201.1 1-acyl-sn-glycerol-3-phosphate acyltransferase [Leptospiraceae bacterium]
MDNSFSLSDLLQSPFGKFILHIYNRVNITGKENVPEGAAILAPNHPSLLDPAMLLLATENTFGKVIRFVAWAGMLDKPVYSDILKFANTIPLNPPGATASEETKKKYPLSKTNRMILEELKQGGFVGIFPEGRNHLLWDADKLYPLQSGALTWSALSGVPIIPVGIKNTQQAWPLLANIELQKLNFQAWIPFPAILPFQIEINYGKPMYVSKEELKDKKLLELKTEELANSLRELAGLKEGYASY